MDVDKLLKGMIDRAKINLQKDGNLAACALLMHQGALIAPVLVSWKDDQTKVDVYNQVGQQAMKLGASGVVLINDVAGRFVRPEDMKHFKKNFDTERPTAYPESLRQEMIAVAYLDLKANTIIPYYQEYKKDGKKIVWGELRTDNVVVMLAGLKEMIMDGYNS